MEKAGASELQFFPKISLNLEIEVVNPIIGNALTVYFNSVQKAGTTVSVRIFYTT